MKSVNPQIAGNFIFREFRQPESDRIEDKRAVKFPKKPPANAPPRARRRPRPAVSVVVDEAMREVPAPIPRA